MTYPWWGQYLEMLAHWFIPSFIHWWIPNTASRKHLGQVHFLPNTFLLKHKTTNSHAIHLQWNKTVASATKHWCCATSKPFELSTLILLLRKDLTICHMCLLYIKRSSVYNHSRRSSCQRAINQWGMNVFEIWTFPKTGFCRLYAWMKYLRGGCEALITS